MSDIASKIADMQTNLPELRSFAGWTQEQLGMLLGITRIQVINLERKRNTLSQTQYIAIRALLDREKADKPLLAHAIDNYFGPDNWKDEIFELLRGEWKWCLRTT